MRKDGKERGDEERDANEETEKAARENCLYSNSIIKQKASAGEELSAASAPNAGFTLKSSIGPPQAVEQNQPSW